MKTLICEKDGSLHIGEVSVPGIDDYRALVKVEACGVCNGTDIKIIHGKLKNYDEYPAILGHEGVGRVVKKGSKVTSFEIGDLVLLPFLEGSTDGYYSAWGAYSEYAVVGDAAAMIKDGKGPGTPDFSEGYYAQQVVPKNINAVNATMIVTFREVLSAIKHFGFTPNSNVVIFGAGPVGLSFIKFSKLLGLKNVIVFDIADTKVDEALSMGADYAFNSKNVDVTEKVRSIVPEGVDFVVDAVGNNGLINQAMELIKDHGKICCYGISPKLDMVLDWSKAPYNWSLKFVQWPSKLEESEANAQIINWINMGVLNPQDFISHVIDFENITSAFEMIEQRKPTKKIVIKY